MSRCIVETGLVDKCKYAMITSENDYSIIAILDKNELALFGGGGLYIAKYYYKYESEEVANDAFKRKIGELCECSSECREFYFSDLDEQGGIPLVTEIVPDNLWHTKECAALKHYFVSDYDDMMLLCRTLEVGRTIFRHDFDEDKTQKGVISCIVRRSENPEWYDKHNLSDYEKKLNGASYSFSGEFILDDDCYCVFAD